jgi:hypothetical protein
MNVMCQSPAQSTVLPVQAGGRRGKWCTCKAFEAPPTSEITKPAAHSQEPKLGWSSVPHPSLESNQAWKRSYLQWQQGCTSRGTKVFSWPSSPSNNLGKTVIVRVNSGNVQR